MSQVPERGSSPQMDIDKYINLTSHAINIFLPGGGSITLPGYQKTPRVEYERIYNPEAPFEHEARARAVKHLPYPMYQNGVRLKLIVSRECLRATRAIERRLIAKWKLSSFLKANPEFEIRGKNFEKVKKRWPEFAELIESEKNFKEFRLYWNRKDLRCPGPQHVKDGKVIGCDGLITEFD